MQLESKETKGEMIRPSIRERSAQMREQYGCEGWKRGKLNLELDIKQKGWKKENKNRKGEQNEVKLPWMMISSRRIRYIVL